MKHQFDTIIIGGGAAGFFAAINIAEESPNHSIAILERSKNVLNKVKISGGGRCNVTHAVFIPKELSEAYPRGKRELLGPFHRFMTGDTMEWFQKRGVGLKIEDDGRIFPISDSSETIVDCLTEQAANNGVSIKTKTAVTDFYPQNDQWTVITKNSSFQATNLVVATGGSQKVWNLLSNLAHTISPPVPSLFTFNCKDQRISGLAGISTSAEVSIPSEKLSYQAPLLITHWGFSGPGILKLSAWGARKLKEREYRFSLNVKWTPGLTIEDVQQTLHEFKFSKGKKQPHANSLFDLPKRLWQNLVFSAGIKTKDKWGDLNKNQIHNLAKALTQSEFSITGKSTFKEEFVTAGGVDLKEINFQTFESKVHKRLYLAGEVLDIDAITGGFNFQNAWTGGYIVAKSIVENHHTTQKAP